MFGDGKVEGIEDNKLTIAFEGQVTKVIREDFVTRKRRSRRLVSPHGSEPDHGPALPREWSAYPLTL